MPKIGLEPTHLAAPEPKSGVSTNFTTWAWNKDERSTIPISALFRQQAKMLGENARGEIDRAVNFRCMFHFILHERRTLLFLSLFWCTLWCTLCIGAEPSSPSIKAKTHIESIGVTQLQLSNGMVCCLKSTAFENDEVFFKLAALGGYASLDEQQRFSGEVADKIAWESGMGGMTTDQLSVFLYENALEFIPSITPFSRIIEGEGAEESLEAFFQCIQMLFTQQQFTKEGLEAATTIIGGTIGKWKKDADRFYETTFLRINTNQFAPLIPMKRADLKKVEFEVAKDFFRQSFSNPGDFICIVVGSFDVDKAIELLEKYVAVIPRPSVEMKWKKSFSVPFPPGITEAQVSLPNQSSCLAHVTFPLQIQVTSQNIREIAYMCQIIEARLREVIKSKMNLSYGVDVSYEFPVYPLLDNPWISIRYRCECPLLEKLKEIVISELKRLQSQGVETAEIDRIKALEERTQDFWLKDNFYWLSMLTNYYLWGWNPENISYKAAPLKDLSAELMNRLIKQTISLSNYSVVIAVPEGKKAPTK